MNSGELCEWCKELILKEEEGCEYCKKRDCYFEESDGVDEDDEHSGYEKFRGLWRRYIRDYGYDCDDESVEERDEDAHYCECCDKKECYLDCWEDPIESTDDEFDDDYEEELFPLVKSLDKRNIKSFYLEEGNNYMDFKYIDEDGIKRKTKLESCRSVIDVLRAMRKLECLVYVNDDGFNYEDMNLETLEELLDKVEDISFEILHLQLDDSGGRETKLPQINKFLEKIGKDTKCIYVQYFSGDDDSLYRDDNKRWNDFKFGEYSKHKEQYNKMNYETFGQNFFTFDDGMEEHDMNRDVKRAIEQLIGWDGYMASNFKTQPKEYFSGLFYWAYENGYEFDLYFRKRNENPELAEKYFDYFKEKFPNIEQVIVQLNNKEIYNYQKIMDEHTFSKVKFAGKTH